VVFVRNTVTYLYTAHPVEFIN